MMKGIIIAAMMVAMAKPINVKKTWADARAAFEAYRFEEAVGLIDLYTKNPKHNTVNDAKCSELRDKALRAAEMMKSVEEITILDSVKTDKSHILAFYGISKEAGSLRMTDDGGVRFTTGRGDRSIGSKQHEGQFDLFLSYSDGESQQLPDNINSTDNESYPFELTDGATLYFASDGHGSIGGYDLFITRYNNETQAYTEPMRLGMPFNSIYNDYMLAIDELSNVGWFATDRYQTKDSVVIYKFRVTESKRLLAEESDEEVRIATAQMKRYKVGCDDSKVSVASQSIVTAGSFRFVVNDTLIYTRESQFRNPLSIPKYHELKELQDAVTLQSVILEGKKLDYQATNNLHEREVLRKEILEDEDYISQSRDRIATLTKEIRKLENLKL